MNKIIKSGMAAILITMLSGCAIHAGYMNNSASLSNPNFSYAQQNISGFAETTYIFGIGGLDKEALVEEAKMNMLKDHPLQPNQALANVAVDWKKTFILVVVYNKCTVTADIVEFK